MAEYVKYTHSVTVNNRNISRENLPAEINYEIEVMDELYSKLVMASSEAELAEVALGFKKAKVEKMLADYESKTVFRERI